MQNKFQKGSFKYAIFLIAAFIAVMPIPTFAQWKYIAPEDVARGVGGSLEEELQRLQEQIATIQSEKNKLQSDIDANNYLIAGYDSQLSALYGEALIYQKDIDELNLQIKEIELNIQVLDQSIAETQSRIEASEKRVSELEVESNKRIKNSYINYRLYGSSDNPTSMGLMGSINSYFKDSQYKEFIQSDTNNLMMELLTLKAELEQDRTDLERKLLEVKQDKELVAIKSEDLKKKKEAVDAKKAIFQQEAAALRNQNAQTQNSMAAFSQEEIQLNAQAELVRQELFNSYNPTVPGEYVLAGRIIGRQGCTGLCTGAHLHFSVQMNGQWQDPCAYLPGGFAPGCGGSGAVQAPLYGTYYYTSSFGSRCFWWDGSNYCDYHTGADFAGSPWNTAIYATHNGYAYKGVDPYGALYVIICENTNCNSGLKSGYWHLSSY
jgi:predicted  nucleic acid-binding Zn-ribbon protein